MQTNTLGSLWPVSALTLGGGGLGQVWGSTTRDEAIATVREAVAAGITLLDLAPGYGDGEAERVVGEAFGGALPEGVRVTTKCRLGNPPAGEAYGILRASLEASLERMKLARVDLFFLHNLLDADAPEGAKSRTSLATYREALIPAFEKLREEGLIGAWGLTGIGFPSSLLQALKGEPVPAAIQCIANLLDSPGALKRYDEPARPREIIAAARARGVGVMGIRAVQAGALTSAFDRELPPDSADAADFERAAPFRALADALELPPALLAHRYALGIPGVDTVVLGVKNREELRECLAAATAGPLPPALIARIDASVATPPA